VVLGDSMGDVFSQLTPDLEGMVKVKTGIDTRPENFVHQVAGVLESVLMHGIGEHRAVGDKVDSCGTEEVGHQGGYGAGYTTMRSGILGMSGSSARRQPRLASDRRRVIASGETRPVIGQVRLRNCGSNAKAKNSMPLPVLTAVLRL
jgi:hypothetical protein